MPAAAQQPASAHSFAVAGAGFVKDGKPYQVISGELHYVRIPRAYWRDRLRKAKAMGLNTITTYAFWNVHEPRPGVYDFTGQNDIAAFIRDAQAEGLDVILRPGPYVCAEWELGGYPAWLLKDRKLVLRSTDPYYTAAVIVGAAAGTGGERFRILDYRAAFTGDRLPDSENQTNPTLLRRQRPRRDHRWNSTPAPNVCGSPRIARPLLAN